MEKNDFIKNKNAKDEKTFKKRKIINGITTAAIFVGCVAIGATIPLLIPAIGGALATSSIAAIAGIGAVLETAGTTMATFGIVESCLIGGAAGAAIGGVGSSIKHKIVGYSILKDENKALKKNKSLAESLEKIDNKPEKVVNKPEKEKMDNNKGPVKVSIPQDMEELKEEKNELTM